MLTNVNVIKPTHTNTKSPEVLLTFFLKNIRRRRNNVNVLLAATGDAYAWVQCEVNASGTTYLCEPLYYSIQFTSFRIIRLCGKGIIDGGSSHADITCFKMSQHQYIFPVIFRQYVIHKILSSRKYLYI